MQANEPLEVLTFVFKPIKQYSHVDALIAILSLRSRLGASFTVKRR